MKAIVTSAAGGPEVLRLQERGQPVPQAGQVLIRVTAVSVNKIDLIQRRECADVILGYECSGQIQAVGENVTEWHIDDWVCALLQGEGYAEFVSVSSDLVFRVPPNVTAHLAASLPVFACSSYYALFACGELCKRKNLLILDGCGEIGLFALRIAKARFDTRVFVVADHDEKLKRYRDHGADECINSTQTNFFRRVNFLTQKQGADIILNYGAVNMQDCVRCLAVLGIIVLVFDEQGTRTANFSLYHLEGRSGKIKCCDLRKLLASSDRMVLADLVNGVKTYVWPQIGDGRIRCMNYKTMPLSGAADAHRLMERRKEIEKVILTSEEKQEWKLVSLFRQLGETFRDIWVPMAPMESSTTKRAKTL